MTAVTCWYHLWCHPDARWREPLDEHLQALARARFTGKFKVGLIGPQAARREALDVITAQRPPDRVAQFDDGWEQRTLKLIRADAKRAPDGITLYCHSKGASHGNDQMAHWRRSMTVALGKEWAANAQALTTLFEATGCHWLDPLPSGGAGFAGNFWMARNSFLASLPPVPPDNRHQAESWIGSGDRLPVLLDLNPGYPGTVPWVQAIGWPR